MTRLGVDSPVPPLRKVFISPEGDSLLLDLFGVKDWLVSDEHGGPLGFAAVHLSNAFGFYTSGYHTVSLGKTSSLGWLEMTPRKGKV